MEANPSALLSLPSFRSRLLKSCLGFGTRSSRVCGRAPSRIEF